MQQHQQIGTFIFILFSFSTLLSIPLAQCAEPQNQVIPLNQPTIISDQPADSYKYFQATINNPFAVYGDILLITASSDVNNYIGMFVITSASDDFDETTWPTQNTQGAQKCSYRSIDTCAMEIPYPSENQTQFNIHFTIYVATQSTYTLEVGISSLYNIKVGHKYSVSLNNAQSAMLKLAGTQFSYFQQDSNSTSSYDEITLLCIYTSFQNIGMFDLIGSLDGLPTSQGQLKTYKGQSFNAFTKILILPSPEDQQQLQDASYYILLQGQNGTSFNFSVLGSSMSQYEEQDSNGSLYYQYSLQMNSTVAHLISNQDSSTEYGTKNVIYSYYEPFPINMSTIYIDLYAYRGWGKFQVNYCNSLYSQTFQNTNGENGQIVITPDLRQQCLSSQSGIIIQSIQIRIIDVYFQFGYMIYINEGSYPDEDYMVTGYKQFGTLDNIDNTQKSYQLGVWYSSKQGQNSNTYILKANTLSGVLIYTISQCQTQNDTCTILQQTKLGQNDQVTKLQFDIDDPVNSDYNETIKYVLTISIPPELQQQSGDIQYSKYSVLLTHSQVPVELTYSSPSMFDIVYENQYNFYFINVSALRQQPLATQIGFDSSATIITIKNQVINGGCNTFVSASDPNPTFQTFFDLQSDTWMALGGQYQYIANQSYPSQGIYIGVLGTAQSIYNLQFVIDTQANIPNKYQQLSENAQNDFTLSTSTPNILLRYTSHIIPYSIVFSPQPSCINFGNSIPLSDTPLCNNANLPTTFTDPVIYFNVSQLQQSNRELRFSVYVNSGNYLLSEDKPLLIGCQKQCYETIVVMISSGSTQAKIMHSGSGSISILPGNTESTSNNILTLECPVPPCSYSLNASINSYFGGSMEVSYMSSWAGRIQWRTKPMPLPQQIGQSTHFYEKIEEYQWQTTFDHSYTFYTEGVDLTIAYTLLTMDQSTKNSMQYIFPSLEYNVNGTYNITTPANYSLTTYVSQGNPLSPTHIVTIPRKLLTDNNCLTSTYLQENPKICIITFSLYINPNVEYSNQYIQTGFGYYSSNTYYYNQFDNVHLNSPIQMEQMYGISYYQYNMYGQQSGSGSYTIHVKPISNCRPVIQIQQNQYTVDYYLDVTIQPMPGQQFINYRIVTNDNCRFRTMLTTSPSTSITQQQQYKVLFSDILYEDIHLQPQSATNGYQQQFIYTHITTYYDQQSAQTFYVDTGINVSQIKVCYLADTSSCPYVVNNISRVVVHAPSNSSQFLSQTSYLITVTNTNNKPISIIAHKMDTPTTILHNQQLVYTYDPYDNSLIADNNDTVTYKYHTLSNILLFVEINRCKVKLTVYNEDQIWRSSNKSDAIIQTSIISNTSQPWVVINDENGDDSSLYDQMQNYLIQFTFLTDSSPLEVGQTATLRLHIQEDGTLGLPNLYMGINKYDAFVHNNAMNCYQYSSPMLLGLEYLHIDLHFASLLTTEEQQKLIELEQEQYSALMDNIKVYVSTSETNQKLNQRQMMISPQTLRTTVDFYGQTSYRVCFTLLAKQTNNNISELSQILKGSQYSVIVNMPSVPMLYKNQYLYNSNIQDNLQFIEQSYQIFQYINYDNDPLYQEELTIMVTNCVGRVNLLASSSYKDMLTGVMTQIKSDNLWTNNGITVGLVDILYGYYYIGISHALTADNIYKLQVNSAILTSSNVPIIAESYFTINWNIKAKAYPLFKGNDQYVGISIPTVVRIAATSTQLPDYQQILNVQRVQYELYLMNLQDPMVKKLKYRIDAYARCPHLLPLEMNGKLQFDAFSPSQVRNVTDFENDNPSTIEFQLPIQMYKPFANISIKAKVYVKSQVPSESGDSYSYRVLTYYYGSDQIQIISGDSSGGLGSPFKWLITVIFVFGSAAALAFLIKWCVKKRRNTVNFQMAEYGGGIEMQTKNSTRKPMNDNTGYGQFVDQSIV